MPGLRRLPRAAGMGELKMRPVDVVKDNGGPLEKKRAKWPSYELTIGLAEKSTLDVPRATIRHEW